LRKIIFAYIKSMKGSQSNDILPLTGVRFLAVIMIFLFHYAYKLSFAGALVTGILNQFFLGVQVFFVLSGFVICYKYFENTEFKKEFFFTYYLRRFARIYPSFFLLTTFTFIFWYFKTETDSSSWKLYLLNITFLKGLSANYYLSGIGPTWSLTVEEIFYLFSPFIFLLFKRKNILLWQVVFWWAVGGILVVLFSAFPFEGFFENAQFVFFVTFFGRCFEFYAGIFLALNILGKYKRQKPVLPKFSFPFYTTAGFMGMALITLSIYKVSQLYGTEASQIFVGIFLTNIIFPISVAFFFFGLIKEASIIQKLFSSFLFQLLGKSSYALFLVHTGVIAMGVEKYLSGNIIILFITLQILAILLYKVFENPVNLWIRGKRKIVIKPVN
jgi:peptidoglycan/LPS O-acetylase OafA/YrhL